MDKKEIIIESARKGLMISEIQSKLPDDTMSYYNIRDFIYSNRYEIAEYNPDHIILLDLGYATKAVLIFNNITSIKKLRSILDEDMNCLYQYGINDKQLDRVLSSVLKYDEEKETKRINNIESTENNNNNNEPEVNDSINNKSISKSTVIDSVDLKLRFLQLISELLEDQAIPKERIPEYGNEIKYSSDNILFTDSFVLLKVDYMKEVLDKYIVDNNIVLSDYSGYKYLNLVSNLLGNNTTIYTKTLNGKKYTYHKFPGLTGNYETYIKIYIDKMGTMINKNILINFNPIIASNPVTTNNTSEFETKNAYTNVINNIRRNIYINSSNKISSDKYIATFTEVSIASVSNDKFVFESEISSGAYIFNPKLIDNNGELYLSSDFREITKDEIEELKRDVVSALMSLSM